MAIRLLPHRPAAAALALAWLLTPLAFAQGPRSAEVTRRDDAIVFDGRIDAESAARFRALAQASGVTRVVITSRGGLVGPALDMAWLVHERGLELEVPSTCLSSCANYVFPAARRKTLGRPDAVAWHGNMAHVLHLAQTGQASWSEEALASARVLARREAEFFARIGVDGFVCWFAKLPPYDVDDFYYLPAQDLERFGIRDVVLRTPAGWVPQGPELREIRLDGAAIPPEPAVELSDAAAQEQELRSPAAPRPASGDPRGRTRP